MILLEERPREREILFSREPVIETLSDPELDAESRESMERWGEKTCLSLPLRFGEVTLGSLVICETERERRFTTEELELARGLANQASAAVHNARVFRDLQERNVELEDRARRERLLNELSLELERQPRSAHRARLGLPAHLRAARRQRRARCGRSATSEHVECLAAWVDGEVVPRTGSAVGSRSRTGRHAAWP